VLQLTALISSLDRATIAPLIVPIAHDLGEGVDAVAIVATAYVLTYGAMQLVWAMVSDHVGRVRTMQLALAIAAVTGLLSAVATNLPLLVAARAVTGAAFAAAIPGSLVYVGDAVPLRLRQAVLADLTTAIAVGFAAGSLGGGFLGQHASWRVAFAATALGAAALTPLVGRLPEPGRRPATSIAASLPSLVRRWGTVMVLALSFVEGFAILGLLVFLPATLQLDGVATSLAGAVTAVYGAAVVTFAWLVKRVSTRWSSPKVIAVGGLGAVVAFGSLAVVPNVWTVLVACCLLGLAWPFLHTTLQTWATETEPAHRAVVVSAFAGMLFVGNAGGVAVGGQLLAAGSVRALFLMGTALAVGLTLVAGWGRSRQVL
jgi:predicted MFS family arabinose efflux permease